MVIEDVNRAGRNPSLPNPATRRRDGAGHEDIHHFPSTCPNSTRPRSSPRRLQAVAFLLPDTVRAESAIRRACASLLTRTDEPDRPDIAARAQPHRRRWPCQATGDPAWRAESSTAARRATRVARYGASRNEIGWKLRISTLVEGSLTIHFLKRGPARGPFKWLRRTRRRSSSRAANTFSKDKAGWKHPSSRRWWNRRPTIV